MNDKHERPKEGKKLSDALLELDSHAATSSAEGWNLAEDILRRDRLRVRILVGAIITFFLLAGWVIYRSFTQFYMYITPIMNAVQQDIEKNEPLAGADLAMARCCQTLYASQIMSLKVVSASVGALLLAAVCTVLLLLATRRAMLRQIQASLLVLSEQVQTLQRSSLPDPSSGAGQTS
jgi:hypothetical protein